MKEYKLVDNVKYVISAVQKWDKLLIWILCVAVLFNAVFPYMYPIISRQVINCILRDSGYIELIYVTIGFAGVFLLLKIIYSKLNLSLWWRFFYLKNRFVINKMEKVMEIPFDSLEKREVLDMMEKAEKSTQGTNGAEGMLYSIKNSMICVVRIILSAAVMSILSPVIVAVALILSIINFKVVSRAKQMDIELLYEQKTPVDRKVGYWTRVSYDRDYAKEIRIFSLKKWIIDKLHEQEVIVLGLLKCSKKNWINATLLNNIISLIQKAIVYGYVIYNTYLGKINIADFVFYTGCIMVLFDTINEIFDIFSTINKQSAEVSEYRKFMDYKNDTIKEEKYEIPAGDISIEFKNVYFKYEGQSEWAIQDLNLKLSRDKKIAIVGKNGSGKSTLIKLMCRLYEPTKGEILLNGVNINNYNKKEYYKIIAPVFQEVVVFAMTLKENVSFVKLGQEDEDKVMSAIKEAGLKERVSFMKKGLNSELLRVMDAEGEELSGGEKQKISLARALYKISVVEILDEPTAALDSLAEKKLYESINELMKKKIGVFISHRLSTTRFCDQIIYMDKGRILERGDHIQLMALEGEYSKLYKLQAQYYVD